MDNNRPRGVGEGDPTMSDHTRTPRKTSGRSEAGTRARSVSAPETPTDDGERLIDFYRQMIFIRRFEERAARGYTQALIGGYCHLNLGEEAAVVGLMAAMSPTDYLFTNYREPGYAQRLRRGEAWRGRMHRSHETAGRRPTTW